MCLCSSEHWRKLLSLSLTFSLTVSGGTTDLTCLGTACRCKAALSSRNARSSVHLTTSEALLGLTNTVGMDVAMLFAGARQRSLRAVHGYLLTSRRRRASLQHIQNGLGNAFAGATHPGRSSSDQHGMSGPQCNWSEVLVRCIFLT